MRFALLLLLFVSPCFAQFQNNAQAHERGPLSGVKSRSQRVSEYVTSVMMDSANYVCAEIAIDTLSMGEQFEGHLIVYLRSLSLSQYVAGDLPYLESFLMLPDSAAAHGIIESKRGACEWLRMGTP